MSFFRRNQKNRKKQWIFPIFASYTLYINYGQKLTPCLADWRSRLFRSLGLAGHSDPTHQ